MSLELHFLPSRFTFEPFTRPDPPTWGPPEPSPAEAAPEVPPPSREDQPDSTPTLYRPARNPLHAPPTPLPPGFPRLRAFAFTHPGNEEVWRATLADFRRSDWGEEPELVFQPPDWPRGKESASRTYRLVLERALASRCDFALILEGDVRVNRRLRANLTSLPLVARDQCDYLSLFLPDLIASPWERDEPHLGYRLARPLYSGPESLWERSRVWGSQGYLLSKRFVRAALERWDSLKEGQDTRVLTVCAEFKLPLWYTLPCLVEHAPKNSAFGTPTAYAPDFDPDFRLEILPGFQPPEEVPGWLTSREAEALWRLARGKRVLEMGTSLGRSTVCLGQSAHSLVTVDQFDQSEAREWARRFGTDARTRFLRGDVAELLKGSAERFDLIFIDTEHDAASVRRDIDLALPLLEPGGTLAFHDYPDPGWPDVRRVVDDYASRLNWKRVEQADFLGVFRVPGG